MDYAWKPADGDWDRLRELAARFDAGDDASVDSDELTRLIERTAAGLGFNVHDWHGSRVNRARQHEFLTLAVDRIRAGSRRLGVTIIAAHQTSGRDGRSSAMALLEGILREEPVRFYRELAQRELSELLATWEPGDGTQASSSNVLTRQIAPGRVAG